MQPVHRLGYGVFAAGAVVVLLLVSAGWWWTSHERTNDRLAGDKRPNVVIITIDTLRADHLGCYGHQDAKTPNIDRFAADAVQFDLATTVSNNTLPSHIAILTGKHPQNFGVPRNSVRFPPGHETLATLLKWHGYETAAFVSASALHSRLGVARGFDVYDETFDTRELDQAQRRAPATTKQVLSWLDRRRSRPFLLWLHYFDPHTPYTPPAPYDKVFYPEYTGAADGSQAYLCGVRGESRFRNADGQVTFPKVDATLQDLRKLVALYDGEIAFLDAELASVLAALDSPEHRAQTMVVFTADHGESLTEHGFLFAHGNSVHQPSMWVPLLIRWPGDRQQGRPACVATPVQTIDICPTVLGALRLAVPQGVEGIDLGGLCRGEAPAVGRLLFGEACQPWAAEKEVSGRWANIGKAQFCLDYPWKLVLTPYQNKIELYHLAEDPGERVNLAPAQQEIVDRLGLALRDWRDGASGEVSTIDPANLEKLRSLGYVE